MRPRTARIARRFALLGAAVLLGGGAAWWVAGDIGGAWHAGTVAPATPPLNYQAAPSAAQTNELADSQGFAFAAQAHVRRDADCARMPETFRRGCRNYLESRGATPVN